MIFVVRDRVKTLLSKSAREALFIFIKTGNKMAIFTPAIEGSQNIISLTKYGIVAILTFILIACGVTGSNLAPNSQSETANTFKVAIILPSAIDDGSWSQSGYEGLKLIEKQLGAKVAYTDKTNNISDAEIKNIFYDYAKQKFDFIIGHGGNCVPPAEAVAKEFLRNKFAVVTTYGGNNANLGSLSFRVGEVGYLTGVVAALKTKTNKVSYIGGMDYPSLKETATLFERGAKAIKPDIRVTIAWVGSWVDKAKAESIAQTQIRSGIDVISVNADPGSQVVHQIAKNKGIYTIGWYQDQYQLAPGTVLTSAIQNIPELLLKGATLVREGRWEGKQYKFGLREKVQYLAPFRGSLTPEQEAIVNKINEDIVTGKIDISP